MLLSYAEFLEIFTDKIDSEQDLPRFNKMLIYTHMDFYNYVYNQAWQYKWYPLLFKFAWNTIRMKPTSFILSLAYILAVETFFEKYTIYKYLDVKMIKATNLFNLTVTK